MSKTASISVVKNTAWQGKLDLVYHHPKDTTKIKSVYTQAPFKIQRPFYPEGKSICHTVIMHTAGGIVGGDILQQNIHLLPNAQVLLTTPSASKIYRSAQKKAIQTIEITLEKDSYLEYLPQETIVFNQAQFAQKTLIKLAENSSFITWEINRFGRSARGEDFSEGKWRNSLEIWQGRKPLWIDRKLVVGENNHFYSLNGLNSKPVVGSLIFIPRVEVKDLILSMRELIMVEFPDRLVVVTKIQKGILCRYHGESVSDCRQIFISLWQLLRKTQNFDRNFTSRIWN